jgi:hypothetical protein
MQFILEQVVLKIVLIVSNAANVLVFIRHFYIFMWFMSIQYAQYTFSKLFVH